MYAFLNSLGPFRLCIELQWSAVNDQLEWPVQNWIRVRYSRNYSEIYGMSQFIEDTLEVHVCLSTRRE